MLSLSGLENFSFALEYLNIIDNNNLNNIIALEGITTIDSNLIIKGNASLVSLSGLENVTFIGGNLSIESNNMLSNLSPLDNVNLVLGDVTIQSNTNLMSLSFLENITSIGKSLNISDNDALVVLPSLTNITFLAGNLHIGANSSLVNLNGLENLVNIEGGLTIQYNNQLLSLDGLQNLVAVEGEFTIDSNNQLLSLNGLNNINSIGKGFTIGDNNALTNLSGLESLTSIGGDFKIWYQDNLINLDGINSLSFIGKQLHILNNDALVNIAGLENLTIIEGSLKIRSCDQLESLYGIHNVNPAAFQDTIVEEVIRIEQNTLLTECAIESMCKAFIIYDLSYYFDSNGEGCNGIIDIISGCSLSSSDGIAFTSQQQIDDFSTNFPELTEIYGNVWVVELVQNDITNLNGLSQLTFIERDLWIENNDSLSNLVGLENLSFIGQDLWIKNNDSLSNLTGLENLSFVGQNININKNESLINLSGLNNLLSIGKDFQIRDNITFTNLSGLNNLNLIGGTLKLENNQELINLLGTNAPLTVGGITIENNNALINLSGLNSIDTIKGSVTIKRNNTLVNLVGLSGLVSLGGGLEVFENESLSSLSGLESLDSIGTFLKIKYNNILENLSGLENITAIGGQLTLSNNSILTTLSGLENIHYLGGLRYFKNPSLINSLALHGISSIEGNLSIVKNLSLTNLSGLDNITSIKGGLSISQAALTNLSGLENLSTIEGYLSFRHNDSLENLTALADLTSIGKYAIINFNDALENLNGLNNLTTIGGKIEVWSNDALTSLSGLDNLTSISGELSIVDNSVLVDISAIQNIAPNTIKTEASYFASDLEIYHNSSLAECEMRSVCDALNIYGITSEIHDNASGCNSREEINCTDYGISGFVYYDLNQNKQQDENETGIPEIQIHFEPSNQSVLSNQNGRYLQLCDEGITYTFSLTENPNWTLTTDSSSYTILFEPGSDANLNNNFGLFPNFIEHKGEINLSSYPTRCNTEVNFALRFQNTGTFMEKGEVRLHYDETTTFITADPMPNEIDEENHNLIWQYDSLFPFQYRDLALTLAMPDENDTGATLNFVSEMYRDSLDELVLLKEYTYSPVVLCSYDPNDKQALPLGEQEAHYTLYDEKLTYTIRFQNTGNAAAIDVRILDTLDTDLDITTFRVLNSSFPVQTSMYGHAVEFLFKNIWLPDSTANEMASHGFVTYEISPVAALDDYTEIENTAYIIFDFNPAIITNTTQNTMVTEIPTGTTALEKPTIFIYPNPASNDFIITVLDNKRFDNVLIFNMLSQLVLTTTKNEINISHLPSGLYLVQVEVDGKVLVGKLVIE